MDWSKPYIFVIVAVCYFTTSYSQSSETYNVLFIAVDDLNDYVGFLGGHPQAITPNLNRLAAESAVFTNAQCPAPKCAPSRAAILAGVRPHDHYVPVPLHFRDIPALEHKTSLPQHFKENGYKTYSIGKVFHGFGGAKADNPYSWTNHQSLMGDRTGFLNTGSGALGLENSTLYGDTCLEQNQVQIPPIGPIDVDSDDYVDTHSARWIANQLLQSHHHPFFMSCGLLRPHIPNYAPSEWFDIYEDSIISSNPVPLDDLDDVPEYALKYTFENLYAKYDECAITDELVKAYLANVAYMDFCLGIMLDALDRSDYKENTIVILWSDHGHHQGEKHHFSKNTLWEESARIPLLVRIPRLSQAGHKIHSPVNLIDLFPTLLDICELPELEVSGQSLIPLMDDIRNEWNFPSMTTLDTFNHSVRTKEYRYIRYKDGTEELYKHSIDPNEWENLIGNSDYSNIHSLLSIQMDDILLGGNGLLNSIPRVKWKSPSRGNAYVISDKFSNLEIPVEVDAYDSDGTVQRVEFWINEERIQTMTSPPYAFNWAPNGAGDYLLKAKVVDNENREIWSSDNRIVVDEVQDAIFQLGDKIYSLFPNPAHETIAFNIYENAGQAISLELFNSNGMLVGEWSSYEANNLLDISYLNGGMYFLRIRNAYGDTAIQKIVKI